ncbi:MAG TPA: cation transporter, partial [Polyangium sp.]|nr:cation transporter [Polyangium sp.]
MSSEEHSTSHIIQSLVANLAIAAGKGVVAFITGSGALLAETLHSTADCGNQLLLLLGVKRAQKKPDASHP